MSLDDTNINEYKVDQQFDLLAFIKGWFTDYCNDVLNNSTSRNKLADLRNDLEMGETSLLVDECIIDLSVLCDVDIDEISFYRNQIESEIDRLVDDKISNISKYSTLDLFCKNNSIGNNLDMKRNLISLESRVYRLEQSLKKEFLGVLNKPTRLNEQPWLELLFDAYPSLKNKFKTNLVAKASSAEPFELILATIDSKYNGLYFVINSTGSRADMHCIAYDEYDNKISSLDSFHLDNDLNKCASFILQTLKDVAINESRYYIKEGISFTSFDCQYMLNLIEDNLSDFQEISADVTDDNADYGFVNFGFYKNHKYITSYDLISNSETSFDIEQDHRKIGSANNIKKSIKIITDHFINNYID